MMDFEEKNFRQFFQMLFTVFLGEPILDPFLYNCTGQNVHVPVNIGQGSLYLILGVIAKLLYLIILKTFWSNAVFWDLACYKIMFFLGIADVLSLVVCADLAGYWSINGLHPCHDMRTSYLLGCFVFGTWHMSCFYVLILAFNRSCELVADGFGKKLFSGKSLNVILSLPLLYFFYFTFFTKPLIYSPLKSTFLLNPESEATKNFSPDLYSVYGFIFNNFFVMFFLAINYCIICSFLLYHSFSTTIRKVSKIYRQVTLQCMIVCTCHFIGCFLYIYMQYVSLPKIYHIIAQLAWIGNHGLPPIVYILFNSTIRSKISVCNLRVVRVKNETTAAENTILKTITQK